jgi:hypothetical protein
MQPHVIVISAEDLPVGDGLVSHAVISSKLWYKTSSVLEAVDVCMKSTFVFSLKFPEASHSSWLFLQKAVYNISTKYDATSTRVSELITDLVPLGIGRVG